mmetsp:Transcript_36893/g.59890  ORF Transcript_36893/g.59890 Transcript_36893/m.59890 type:complete len:938 (+) Transcript_36893:6607-9420(+)|eukprot:CAMPEP_0203751422 /NCGR_PEP_ID=MMETSP0098-20131031/5503_1 /ASSEMBLY_ACC=CAM_ASM_000208 /TAXON_ID=96639 /ORGANISM=" , Strain NY0313808BC1" /LENGTH=937 /DNA_ID=CAMNT_0050641145 /DNA_START=142 /DNA_END=2955 /DNA_ORIENTATION=+
MQASGVYKILLFYQYVDIPQDKLTELEAWLHEICQRFELMGRVLIAPEGINGNIASKGPHGIDVFCEEIIKLEVFKGCEIDFKLDYSDQKPFPDYVIKKKREICSTGNSIARDVLDKGLGGQHLSPTEFHAVLDEYWGSKNASSENKKDLVVLDVRNRVEFKTGRFMGSKPGQEALDPCTKTFAQWFKDYASKKIDDLRDKKVVMYCTGGIRCEKASAYLRASGVEDVSQLGGGIHRYLEKFGSEGYFKGSNFVFDSRALQTPANAQVVGKCFECDSPEQGVSTDRCCTVCRAPVLVCDPCRGKLFGVYYCDDHMYLKGAYFAFLGRFTDEELLSQVEKLGQVALEQPKHSSRKKSINKHIKRIQDYIVSRNQRDQALKKKKKKTGRSKWTQNPRCRSCGLIGPEEVLGVLGRTFHDKSVVCDGKCSGFSKGSYDDPKQSLDRFNDEDLMNEVSEMGRKRTRTTKGERKYAKRLRTDSSEEWDSIEYDIVQCATDNTVKLRTVKPYMYDYQTNAKTRWVGEKLLDMYVREFATNQGPYYKLAIQLGLIQVNGEKVDPTYQVRNADVIGHLVHRHEPPVLHVSCEDMIVADTKEFLIVDKPASVAVHPCGSYRRNSLIFILARERGMKKLFPIHRLDRLTSGLVIFAKDNETAAKVSDVMTRKTEEQNDSKKIQKSYLARVHGKFPTTKEEFASLSARLNIGASEAFDTSEKNQQNSYLNAVSIRQTGLTWEQGKGSMLELDVQTKLGKDVGSAVLSCPLRCASHKYSMWECDPTPSPESVGDGSSKPSMTRIRSLGYDPESDTSLVQCEPITGRTHQLRLHLTFLGFPIVNDPNYGKDGNVAQVRIREEAHNQTLGEAAHVDINDDPEKYDSSKAPEELTKYLCVACQKGMDVAFNPVQLRYNGLDLHAYRYKITLDDGTTLDYSTRPPRFALPFLA